ncbi:MAG: DUF1385 domain-containing protein [Bdellovibrionales bacterium]|nr:DUF1385 domain-containing protein [Bdellovibrionales bacterium]
MLQKAPEGTEKSFTSIGGQAVIEGVMMRSPKYMTVAIRKPDGQIVVRGQRVRAWGERFPFLKTPFIRGISGLFEMMILGMSALSFSAQIAEESENAKNGGSSIQSSGSSGSNGLQTALSMAVGIGAALLLFVAMPHALSAWILGFFYPTVSSVEMANLPAFHAVDGVLKLIAMILYVLGISMIPEIKRVFQYHGAEHKSIYAFESGMDLNVENAKTFRTQHPRCGTSFLFFLIFVGFVVFSVFFPLLGIRFSAVPDSVVLTHAIQIVTKIGLMLPVAGISYEIIKWSARHQDQFLMRIVMAPGLWVQNLTTKPPADDQLEVALAALKQALFLEKTQASLTEPEILTAKALSEIRGVSANVREFAEV